MAFRGLNEDCYVAGSIQGNVLKENTTGNLYDPPWNTVDNFVNFHVASSINSFSNVIEIQLYMLIGRSKRSQKVIRFVGSDVKCKFLLASTYREVPS